MKKFEGVLFCTDLDGTLYRDDKTVSRENLAAIDYFRAEGGIFTFITGRPPMTAKEICKTLSASSPYGCANGAAVYDPVKGAYLWNLVLQKEAMELVRAVTESLPDITVQWNTETQVIFDREGSATDRFCHITGLPHRIRAPWEVTEPVLKVVFIHEKDERIEALAHFLNGHPLAERFDFIRSEKILYEILPKGASKGGALKKMTELMEISPEKTVAAGDYNNDISMVSAAGLGFAVANGVPEVKAAADHITVSNNENAIAAIIEGLDSGRYTFSQK